MDFSLKTKLQALCLLLVCSQLAFGQTYKYWVGASAGNWGDNANWSSSSGGTGNTTTYPSATTDVAVFDANSGTPTVYFQGSYNIGQLSVNNATVNLQAAAGARVLSITGTSSGGLIVDNNSYLKVSGRSDASNNMTLYLVGGSSTVNNSVLAAATTNGQGVLTNNAGAANLTFGAGATYLHGINNGTLPKATWSNGSVCSVTGITSINVANGNQNFYDFVWNSPLTGNVYLLTAANSQMTVRGTFSIVSTGGNMSYSLYLGSVTPVSYSINNFNMQAGTLTGVSNSTYIVSMSVTGDFMQTEGSELWNGGTFNLYFTGDNDSKAYIVGGAGVGLRGTSSVYINKSTSQNKVIAQHFFGVKDLHLIRGDFFMEDYKLKTSGGVVTYPGGGFIRVNQNSDISIEQSSSSTIDVYMPVTGNLNSLTSTRNTVVNILGSLSSIKTISVAGSGIVNISNDQDATCNAFTQSAGTVNLLSGKLTMTGPLSITGGVLSFGGASMYVGGNAYIEGAAYINSPYNDNLTFSGSSVYIHNSTGAYLPEATWLDGSVCSVTGFKSGAMNRAQNNKFYDFVWNSPQTGDVSLLNASNRLITVRNTFKVVSTGEYALYYTTSAITVAGMFNHFKIEGGAFRGTTLGSVTVPLTITGNFIQTGGSSINSTGPLKLYFKGGTEQELSLSSPMSGDCRLYISKDLPQNQVTLQNDISLVHLYLEQGRLKTNNHSLTVTGNVLSVGGNSFISGDANTDFTLGGLNTGTANVLLEGNYRNVSFLRTSNYPINLYAGTATYASFTKDGVHTLNIMPGSNITTDFVNINGGNFSFAGGNLQVGQQLAVTGTGALQKATVSNLSIGANGTYIHGITSLSLPLINWGSNATCSITGITTGGVVSNLLTQTNIQNIVWDCANQTGNGYLLTANGQNLKLNSLTVNNTGSATLSLTNVSAATATVTGTFNKLTLNGGTLSGATNGTGNAMVTVTGDLLGTAGILTGYSTTKKLPLTLNGGASQLQCGGTLYADLTIDKDNPSTAVTISGDLNLKGNINHKKGTLQQSSFTVTQSSP